VAGLWFGALPECVQQVGEALGLDPVWQVEVVTLGERLENELGEIAAGLSAIRP
jgi:hypothetical protein